MSKYISKIQKLQPKNYGIDSFNNPDKMNNEVKCANPECKDGKIGYGLNNNVIKPCPDCTYLQTTNEEIESFHIAGIKYKCCSEKDVRKLEAKLKQQAEEIQSHKAFLSYYTKKITELKKQVETLEKL